MHLSGRKLFLEECDVLGEIHSKIQVAWKFQLAILHTGWVGLVTATNQFL
jgi:hypothetical protein